MSLNGLNKLIALLIMHLILMTATSYALIFPIFSFSNDSGGMYGLFVQHKLSETNEGQLLALSSSKGITSFVNVTNIPILNEKVNVSLSGSTMGEPYYGIGNTTRKTEYEHLYFDEFNTSMTLERKLSNTWDALLGVTYKFYKENTEKNETAEQFTPLSLIGLIIGAQIDKRNREYNTTSGYLNKIQLKIFPEHQVISNDIRYFYPTKYGIIASKLFTIQTFTTTDHFQFLNGAGNYLYLRGYKGNDLLDRHLSYAQLEFRIKLLSWYVLTPFIETGVSGQSPTQLKKQLFSYGIGSYFFFGNGAFRFDISYAEGNRKTQFGFNHVF